MTSGWGNRQDAFGTLRKSIAEATVHIHQPAGHFHLHQHTDGCAYPGIEDLQSLTRYVRGGCADSFDQPIEQKIFHCEIVVDAEKVKREEKAYKPIPVITDFTDENGLYEGNGAGELQTHQGGGETDCHRRAGAYRW